MKRLKTVLTIGLVITMLFPVTSCGKRITEYSEDSIITILEDDLGIDEDEIYTYENHREQNGLPDAEIVTARYGDARINAMFIDDPDEAKQEFDNYYDEFTDSFDANGQFDGNYVYENSDDYGYIVVNGTDIGTQVFGSRFATGEVYIGLYYTGSMLIAVTPEDMDGDLDDVGEVIASLGFPNV